MEGMLRITKLEAESESRLLVEGRETRDTVNELARLSDGCFASSATLALDLSGVTFVDLSGVPLLKTLRARGATLEGCSGYVTELLDRASGKEASREAADPLVEGLRRGDEEAFAALVRREGARLLATARRLLGSTQDAEDAVQEAFLQAHRAIDRFNGDSRLSTWLHRIVVNAALMKLRSRRRKPEQALDELLPQFDESGAWLSPVTGWDRSSYELLESAEIRAMVRRAIERLPDAYREVLILRDIEELDTEETAELLDASPNAIKVRLHRARQALRTLLEGSSPSKPPAPAFQITDETADRG
jgi:RNA polymerase sigma-70 factor, ECF subfamily